MAAIGAADVSRNVNMGELGAGDGAGLQVLSHGYLSAEKYSAIFRAYQAIKNKFEEP